MVEAPPAAGATASPLLYSLSQYHDCYSLFVVLILTVFPFFLPAAPCSP